MSVTACRARLRISIFIRAMMACKTSQCFTCATGSAAPRASCLTPMNGRKTARRRLANGCPTMTAPSCFMQSRTAAAIGGRCAYKTSQAARRLRMKLSGSNSPAYRGIVTAVVSSTHALPSQRRARPSNRSTSIRQSISTNSVRRRARTSKSTPRPIGQSLATARRLQMMANIC